MFNSDYVTPLHLLFFTTVFKAPATNMYLVDDVVLPAVVSKLKVKQKLNSSGDLSFLKGTFSTDGQNMTEEDYNMF